MPLPPSPSSWVSSNTRLSTARTRRDHPRVTDWVSKADRESVRQQWRYAIASLVVLLGLGAAAFWLIVIWFPDQIGVGPTRFVNESGEPITLYEYPFGDGPVEGSGLSLGPGEAEEWNCGGEYLTEFVLARADGSVVSAPVSWCDKNRVVISPCWVDPATTGNAWQCRTGDE